MYQGGFRGRGERGRDAFCQGFDPLPTQRVPSLDYFDVSIFEPKYNNFEGGARAKKTQFFGQNFQKSAFFRRAPLWK